MKKFNKIIKKALALVLIFTIMLTGIIGCGSKGNSGKVMLPKRPKEYTISENMTNATLQQYVYARLKLEQLTQAKDVKEFEKILGETIEAFKYADEFSEKAVQYADYALLANNDNPKETGMIIETNKTKSSNPFIMKVNADDGKDFDAKAWAEGITKTYDSGQAGQQVRNLSEQLGVDAKEAYNQLLAAQDIIKKGADADANFFDTAMKAAMATKTACKVGLLVTGTIVTAGGVGAVSTMTFAAGDAAVLAINAADCIVDIGVTSSTIILGEDNKVTTSLNAMADKLAPVTALTGLHGLYKTDWADVVKITDATANVFDYVGQSLIDYMYNDKVMGIDVTDKKDGKTEVKVTAVDVPYKSDNKVDTDKLNKELEQAKLPTIPTEEPELKSIDETIQEFEKTMPNPTEVSKQIDQALKDIEKLLKELDKISDINVVGTYSGTDNRITTGIEETPGTSTKDATIEVILSDKTSNTYTIKYIDSMNVHTFTGKISNGHFESSEWTSANQYHEVVSSRKLSIDFSKNGGSLKGTMVNLGTLNGLSYTQTITTEMKRK